MQLKTIFLSVVLVLVEAKEERRCGDAKANECLFELLSVISLQEVSDEEFCAAMSKAIDCMDEVADGCIEAERNRDIDNERQELRRFFSRDCPGKEYGTLLDIEQCVRGLKLELMKCVSDGAAVVVENIAQSPDETGVKEDEIKCSLYQFAVKCAVQKVEDSCGKEAAQLELEKMLDAPEEIKGSCGNKGINGALRGVAYDIVKRRK
ncbi:hypothetical protein AVEN_40792-1 [Araneus ventricosus]|uniref:DUF19 domain-containing protein n=1 Tax=Araneus ventricosus TaxID=182803 RepID=A0A4Y2CFJ2_ARAVE|nr:hypothetical protein AVEN_40792-1 [Araneus ventricosus]